MRRRGVAAAALGAALVLTGCSSADSAPDSDSSTSTPDSSDPDVDAPRIPGLPARIDYVALGDSYTAGPLVTVMRNDPSGCMRSQDNYPAFLAQWIGAATYTDRSCSAARTNEVRARQPLFDGTRARPQLGAITRQTDLVTIGLGGNDFGLFQSLIDCLPRGACTPDDAGSLADAATRIDDNVEQVVDDVRRRAPRARILVVGYPQVLPEAGSCPGVRLPAELRQAAVDVAAGLNRSLRDGARRGGATYVDLVASTEGHDICAGKQAWVNGPTSRPGIAAPFHPTIEGMRNTARVIFELLAGEQPSVETELAEPDPSTIR